MKREFDVVVVGGGITGLGVGLAASRWGFECAIFERGVLASGTSANSLRIIHGGLRYFQSLDIRRVLESVREQAFWLQEVPHLIKPLPCLMPLDRWGIHSTLPVGIVGSLYAQVLHLLGSPLKAPRILRAADCSRRLQSLSSLMPHGALCWEDALLLDHSAFVRYLRAKIESQGTEVHEGRSVEMIRRERGRWTIHVQDAGTVSARVLVDARSESGAGDLRGDRNVVDAVGDNAGTGGRAAAAINLEFDFLLEPEAAVGLRTKQGRLFFAVPRDERTVIGTWYYPHAIPDERRASEEARFVQEIREAFHDDRFTPDRVVHRDHGLLPMRRMKGQEPVLWGRHAVTEHDGLITVRSTKYTTFRLVGEEALKKAARTLQREM